MEGEISMEESLRAMLNPARAEGESMEAYRLRRKLNQARTQAALKGRLVWNCRTQGTYINKEKKNAKSK